MTLWMKANNWFSERCMAKMMLPRNAQKAGWQHMGLEYLLQRIRQELEEELAPALMDVFVSFGSPDMVEKAINECVDVANFAMMLADNLRRVAHDPAAEARTRASKTEGLPKQD